MANNSHVTADLAELKKWNEDTKSELQAVRATLDRVSKVCSELDDDDTINGMLKKLGNAIGEEYIEMCNTFQQCAKLTEEVIGLIGKGVSNIAEFISNFARKFHR
jgi:hypothetical protein